MENTITETKNSMNRVMNKKDKGKERIHIPVDQRKFLRTQVSKTMGNRARRFKIHREMGEDTIFKNT